MTALFGAACRSVRVADHDGRGILARMRILASGLSVVAVLSSACVTVRTGDGTALQRWIQVEVVGDVVVDTGNPDVVAPRYRYRSLESFDVAGVMAATTLGGGVGPTAEAAWLGEREEALEHARADLLRRAGPCVGLVNASASVVGAGSIERRAFVTTPTDVELEEAQIEGLCRGGPLP